MNSTSPNSSSRRQLAPVATTVLAYGALILLPAAGVANLVGDPTGSTKIRILPASGVELLGSSNLGSWACRKGKIEGTIDVAAPARAVLETVDRAGTEQAKEAASKIPAPRFRLRIPISSFSCGNRTMERDLHDTLSADRHPAIVYEFERLGGLVAKGADRRQFDLVAIGDLALAGSERALEVHARADRSGPRTFRISGELPVKMTDFGIRPPTALFGLVRAKDHLIVRFDLRLEIPTPPEGVGP
jgi:YceI-like domain